MADTKWLEEALGVVAALNRQHVLKKKAPEEPTDDQCTPIGLRGNLVPMLTDVVQRLARCRGVTGAFAAQEGLVMEVEGAPLDYEAFAAVAQQVHGVCKQAGDTLALGQPAQVVISGVEHKLALFFIGDIGIGVVAPSSVALGAAIAGAS